MRLSSQFNNIGNVTRRAINTIARATTTDSNNQIDDDIDFFYFGLTYDSLMHNQLYFLTNKAGIESDMNKILDNVSNPNYSKNLKKRLSVLIQNLNKEKKEYATLYKENPQLTSTYYFQTILLQRQLIDAILHELVMIRIANKIITEMENIFSKSGGIRGGGKVKELFLLILGVILLTFASNEVSMNDGINGIINKDTADLQNLRDAALKEKKKELEQIFAVSSETTISNSKGGETFNVLQQGIIFKQLSESLAIINEKYKSYKLEIIKECKKSFTSVHGLNEDVASLNSIYELLVYDAATIDSEQLKDLSLTEATQQLGESVGVLPGMVGAFSTGVWNGMFGTKEIEISKDQSTQKEHDNQEALTAYIEQTAKLLETSQNQAFSIIAGKLFMDIQCSYMPTGKYTVVKEGNTIVVKSEYATQNTGKIIDSLALLMAKIKYLKNKPETDKDTINVLNLHSEKVIQLLTLANYGPFFVIPSGDIDDTWNAGQFLVEAESKFRFFEVEALKLFEDFSETKEKSKELLRAIHALGELDRNKRRELTEEFWKNLAQKMEIVERAAENVREGTTKVAKGIVDIGLDSTSYFVNRSVEPFFKLALMGATGIGLMILFYCAVPLIRLYISKHTPAAPVETITPKKTRSRKPKPNPLILPTAIADPQIGQHPIRESQIAPPSIAATTVDPQIEQHDIADPPKKDRLSIFIPIKHWKKGEQANKQPPTHEGGKSQKKRKTTKKSKTYKLNKRNRLFVKRK